MKRKPNTSCSCCGAPLYRRPSDQAKCVDSFCDAACERKGRDQRRGATTKYNGYVARWKAGAETGMRGQTGISNHIRRYMFEKYGHKCCQCGWAEINATTGRIPLSVDHINGDFTDNREENLRLLCPNCDSLTATYKSLNNGHGRPGRQ